jgi:hypothetical protein
MYPVLQLKEDIVFRFPPLADNFHLFPIIGKHIRGEEKKRRQKLFI